MPISQRTYTCLQCRIRSVIQPPGRLYHASNRLQQHVSRGAAVPKWTIDLRHIRQNVALYEKNCRDRNYKEQALYPQVIEDLNKQWHESEKKGRSLRARSNRVKQQLASP